MYGFRGLNELALGAPRKFSIQKVHENKSARKFLIFAQTKCVFTNKVGPIYVFQLIRKNEVKASVNTHTP